MFPIEILSVWKNWKLFTNQFRSIWKRNWKSKYILWLYKSRSDFSVRNSLISTKEYIFQKLTLNQIIHIVLEEKDRLRVFGRKFSFVMFVFEYRILKNRKVNQMKVWLFVKRKETKRKSCAFIFILYIATILYTTKEMAYTWKTNSNIVLV